MSAQVPVIERLKEESFKTVEKVNTYLRGFSYKSICLLYYFSNINKYAQKFSDFIFEYFVSIKLLIKKSVFLSLK